ncbi:unnamed protein product [Auanema sp. JU1783]|nr:unnamed protein product [Auanema sp. JU1783]
MTDFYNSSINAELSDVLREVWINDASGENGNSSYNQAEGADENGEIIEAPNNSLVLESDLFFNPPDEDEVTIKEEEWMSLRQKDSGINDTVNEMVTNIKRAWDPSPHVGREAKIAAPTTPRQFNNNNSRYNNANNMEMWSTNEKPQTNFSAPIPNMQPEFGYHNQPYIPREAYHTQPVVPQAFNPVTVNRNVQHPNQISMTSFFASLPASTDTTISSHSSASF